MSDYQQGHHTGEGINWDYSVDVLVVGSGFAGFSAAIEASESGVSILIIEKMKSHGGNSVISDGGIAAPGTSLQKKHGIDDCIALMKNDMLTAGLGLNHPDLLNTVVENAKDAFDWTRDKLRVPYMDRVDIFGGHSIPRCYTPVGITGATIIKKMFEQVKTRRIPIRYSVSFRSLITSESGSVLGAVVLEDYDYKSDTGTLKKIRARKGIVLSTGGYGADIAFRSIQDPRLHADIQTTNKPFTTAEGLMAALRIGAAPVQLSQIQLGGWASPDEKGFGDGPLFADYILFQYGIIIDPKTGKRFVNELGDRKVSADAILHTGHPCVGIADQKAVAQSGWDISKAIRKGVVKLFDTIDELANEYGIDLRTLGETLSAYNQDVLNGKDIAFGKQIVADASAIETVPFYAMRLWPKVHFTMGGIAINKSAQVTDFSGNAIRGLYAAGEVVGGVHGASRLGSCAITECVVFGRIAGHEAASRMIDPIGS